MKQIYDRPKQNVVPCDDIFKRKRLDIRLGDVSYKRFNYITTFRFLTKQNQVNLLYKIYPDIDKERVRILTIDDESIYRLGRDSIVSSNVYNEWFSNIDKFILSSIIFEDSLCNGDKSMSIQLVKDKIKKELDDSVSKYHFKIYQYKNIIQIFNTDMLAKKSNSIKED